MMGDLSPNVHEWSEKKLKLSSILNENVKGALVRNRFLSIKDIDSPTSFFSIYNARVYKLTKCIFSVRSLYIRTYLDLDKMNMSDFSFVHWLTLLWQAVAYFAAVVIKIYDFVFLTFVMP